MLVTYLTYYIINIYIFILICTYTAKPHDRCWRLTTTFHGFCADMCLDLLSESDRPPPSDPQHGEKNEINNKQSYMLLYKQTKSKKKNFKKKPPTK